MNYAKKPASHHAVTLLASLAIIAVTSVSYAGPLKADPEPVSPFIQHPGALTRHQNLPFNKAAINSSQQAWARVNGFDNILILPINTQYLQPYKQPANGLPPVAERRPVGETSTYIRTQFEHAFAKGGKFHVVSKPQRKTLTLEIALIDLRPSVPDLNPSHQHSCHKYFGKPGAQHRSCFVCRRLGNRPVVALLARSDYRRGIGCVSLSFHRKNHFVNARKVA